MSNHAAMSLSEYQSAYAGAVRRLLEASQADESGAAAPAALEKMRAIYREISALRLNDGDHFVLAKDRLALATRIIRQDFNRWLDGLSRNAQSRPKTGEAIRRLESEVEKLAEQIQEISLEMETGKHSKHDQYTALVEKYIEKYIRKLQYLNSPHPTAVSVLEEAISGLKDFLIYLEDCYVSLSELNTGNVNAVNSELKGVIEELRRTMKQMSSLPGLINGIDQSEEYREFKRLVDRLQEAIEGLFLDIPLTVAQENVSEAGKPAAETPGETGSIADQPEAAAAQPPADAVDAAENRPKAISPSPGPNFTTEAPEDVQGLIEYLTRCESEEEKAAARQQLQQWLEGIGAFPGKDEGGSSDAVKSLLLEIRKFRLTLLNWLANLDSFLGNDLFKKVREHQEKLSDLEQKIADHRAKLDSPNYSDARKKRFEMALAKYSKDYEREKKTEAALKTELAQIIEPYFARLSDCSDALDACKKLLTALAQPEREQVSEELADALNEIRFIELWCNEQAGIGDLLKVHTAYRRLLHATRDLGEILKENSPGIALSLPVLPDDGSREAARVLPEKDGQVLKTVKRLRDRLRDRLTGHTVAYRHLLNREDQTLIDALHHDLAENEWLKIYKENPRDWIACHHLAILYHARAFDLEMEGKEQEATMAWENALKYWQKSIEHAEPVASIRSLLQNLERYKEGHDRELAALSEKMVHDLLAIHHRWYDYYISRKKEEQAERHYSILEKVPLEEKHPILQSIYEKNYGSKVAELSKRFKNKKDEKSRIQLAEEVERFYKRIKPISRRRSSLASALRDLVMLCGWRLQIEFSKWLIKIEQAQARLEPLVNERKRLSEELERLHPQIDELESQLKRGNHTVTNRYNDMAGKYNQKARRYRELDQQIGNEWRRQIQTIEDLVINARECEEPLSQLIASDDNAAKQRAAIELQEAVSEIFSLEKELGDQQPYRNLKQKCEELQKQIKALRAGAPVAAAPAASVADNPGSLWSWVEFKKEENPYANTAFLLLQTELPALTEKIDVQKLLIRMRQKKQYLERVARAGRHSVLGRNVSREELNKALAKLDSPLDLAKDMLLQHQSHPLDTEDIKAELEGIELPPPDNIPVEISRGIFALFTVPALPEGARREWKKPESLPPGERTKPRIQWPT